MQDQLIELVNHHTATFERGLNRTLLVLGTAYAKLVSDQIRLSPALHWTAGAREQTDRSSIR
jgi:hypothetical protein